MPGKKKMTAQCKECGRRTSVRRDGKLHVHNHPGWRTRCPCDVALPNSRHEEHPDAMPLFDLPKGTRRARR